jgi:hypothetical protein
MTTLQQAARIQRRVHRYADLMALLQAQGLDPNTASKIAFKLVIAEDKARKAAERRKATREACEVRS